MRRGMIVATSDSLCSNSGRAVKLRPATPPRSLCGEKGGLVVEGPA